MATISKVKTAASTLTAATADLVQLTQVWDRVEVANATAAALYVRFDGVTAVGAADGTELVGASSTKVLYPGAARPGYVPGSTTAPAHAISLVGTANAYTVTGLAGY